MTDASRTATRSLAVPVLVAAAGCAAAALLYLFGGAVDFAPPSPGAVEAAAETASRRDAAVMFVRVVGFAMLAHSATWLLLTGLRRNRIAKFTSMVVGAMLLARTSAVVEVLASRWP